MSITGNELSRASLRDALSPSEHEDSGADRRELEQWASEIAACLQQVPPVRSNALGPGGSESELQVPDGWRRGVEVLTPGEGLDRDGGTTQGPGSSLGTESSPEHQRLQVRVKTAELGEVAVVVERLETGLRVLLGVSDPRAIAAIERDSRAMLQALETDGQAIQSLEIVRMNGVGTDLAHSKVASGQRPRRSHETADSDLHSGTRKRKAKRLDVTG